MPPGHRAGPVLRRRHGHEELGPAEHEEVVGHERPEVHAHEDHRKGAQPPVQVEQPRRPRLWAEGPWRGQAPEHRGHGEEPGHDPRRPAMYHQKWLFIVDPPPARR